MNKKLQNFKNLRYDLSLSQISKIKGGIDEKKLVICAISSGVMGAGISMGVLGDLIDALIKGKEGIEIKKGVLIGGITGTLAAVVVYDYLEKYVANR